MSKRNWWIFGKKRQALIVKKMCHLALTCLLKVLLRQRHRILVFISCLRPIFLSCKIERTRKFVQTFSLRIKERFMLCPLRTSGYVNRKHSKLKYYTHVYFIQRTFTQRLQKPLVLFLHLFKLINSVIWAQFALAKT